MSDSVTYMDTLHNQSGNNLALTVRALLLGAGITVEDAAKALGLSRSSMIRRLNAETDFTYNDLAALAARLGTSISEITRVAELVPVA